MLISGEKYKFIFLISVVSSELIVSYSEWISSDFCYIIQTSKVLVNIQKDNAGKAGRPQYEPHTCSSPSQMKLDKEKI